MRYLLLILTSLLFCSCSLSAQPAPQAAQPQCVHLDVGQLSQQLGKPLMTIALPQKPGEDIQLQVNASMLMWIIQQSMVQGQPAVQQAPAQEQKVAPKAEKKASKKAESQSVPPKQ